ncbi:MAG TPA: DUF1552 domain-containing protein [Kofleriaceae bacterium]|nr:DUF1552 domain-containing protein [Kofleriaceae bacterium]
MSRKSSWNRRRFLGGAGVMIGLPLLSSLLPRRARGAEPVRKKRFVGFYVPCGIVMANWTPPDEGASWSMTPILSPLEPYRDRTLVLTGVNNSPGRSDGGGDHAAGTGSFLTCTHVYKTTGADIRNGTSLDQLIAPTLSQGLPFPSLELGTDGGAAVGDCDTGYSCAYARSIAWKNATTPLPKQTSPRGVFDRMFAGYDPDATAAELEKRRAYRKSVLDYALDDATALRDQLGRTDQLKLDEYLTSVREVEQRVDGPVSVCQPGTRPGTEFDPDTNFAAVSHAMIDLIAVAFACDQTRVITFMLGNAGSYHAHPQVGVTESHHELSHHMGIQSNLDKLTLINTWEVGELAYLMSKLDAIDDGDGFSALDNSIIFFGSEIEDGDAHRHTNMPIIVAGGGSGKLATGVHRRLPGQTQGNLFVSFLQAFGVAQSTFGDDGTTTIPGLLL